MSKNSRSFITELLKWAAVCDSNVSRANPSMYSAWQANEKTANALWGGVSEAHTQVSVLMSTSYTPRMEMLSVRYLRDRSSDRPEKSKKFRYSDATNWLKSLLQRDRASKHSPECVGHKYMTYGSSDGCTYPSIAAIHIHLCNNTSPLHI